MKFDVPRSHLAWSCGTMQGVQRSYDTGQLLVSYPALCTSAKMAAATEGQNGDWKWTGNKTRQLLFNHLGWHHLEKAM